MIESSVISGNTATGSGGGITNGGASLTLINSTVSNNTAGHGGGGVDLPSLSSTTLLARNSTISGNRSNVGSGGGIDTFGTAATLHNTIVAGNFQGTGTTIKDIDGPLNLASSFNLIGDATTAGGLTDGTNGNIVGADPMLGPLQDNGGPTFTHALLAGSPAINAGNNSEALDGLGNVLATDQRAGSFIRIANATVDIGAFETALTSISARHVFYNNATGTNLSSAGAADNAIDTSKSALRTPGATSTNANSTNYSRGLNGIIVDIAGLPAGVTDSQMLSSLQFARWNGIDAGGFTALPGTAVPTVTVLAGSGAGGSARVKITFPDNSLRNTWLRVTVLANVITALATDDVFYFGHVLGDTGLGNTATRLRVNATDTGAVRSNQSTASNSVGVTNIYDINRDGRVNATDTGLVRSNQQTAGIVAPLTVPLSIVSAGAVANGSAGDGDISLLAPPLKSASTAMSSSSSSMSNRIVALNEAITASEVGLKGSSFVSPEKQESKPEVVTIKKTKSQPYSEEELALRLRDNVFASLNAGDWV